jgi:hypothetical protein
MNDKGKFSINEIMLIFQKLSEKFPVKENLCQAETERIKKFFNERNHVECVKIIRKQFGLGVRINIRRIDDNFQDSHIHFSTKGFLKYRYDSRSVAAVILPSRTPIYGSHEFKAMTIPMIIKESLFRRGCEAFMCGVGHEMSHIILYSLYNEYRESEVATDILAMMMGFSEIGKSGSGEVGYLKREEFNAVYKAIQSKQHFQSYP